MDAEKQFENELSAVFVRWWEESDLDELEMARIAVIVVDRFCSVDIEYEGLDDEDMEIEFEPGNSWEISAEWNPDDKVGSYKRMKTWTRKILPKSIL